MPADGSRTAYLIWCATTVFVSAFLLFEVQPLISKAILPWFGGSPAVWSTCMLFFQVLLLAGYAYAHALTQIRSATAQMLIHCALLAVAVIVLPILPEESWKPTGLGNPTWGILLILSANIGLPYFMLSATGPLAQAWFARRFAQRSPYRLYALSNVGSLLALLAYPFWIEPLLPLARQGLIWSALFVLFAVLCAVLAFVDWKGRREEEQFPDASAAKQETAGAIQWQTYLLWIGYPALASILLLAVTNHLCQDVAVVPFLWVAPLSLYLLTFIICFDREIWYFRKIYSFLGVFAAAAMGVILYDYRVDVWVSGSSWLMWLLGAAPGTDEPISTYTDDIVVQIIVFLSALFCFCMTCHGELVRSKPSPKHLTKFYLCVAAGGAVGGFFVSLAAPYLFNRYMELQISGIVACAVSLLVFLGAIKSWVLRGISLPLGLGMVAFVSIVMINSVMVSNLASERNFYGVLRVDETLDDDGNANYRTLYHGRIMHGVQFLQEHRKSLPTSYYVADSGVGLAIDKMRVVRSFAPLRIGAIGLGTGTVAAYGLPGDSIQFYEINPKVLSIAGEYFTYLSDSPAEISIVQGDARISLERQESQQFDVLIVDAFSGDAIPIHLITKEAVEIYQRHLKPDGVLAVHISNIHLDLRPIVHQVGEAFGYRIVWIDYEETDGTFDANSDWLLLTRGDSAFLNDPLIAREAETTHAPEKKIRMWTDQYSNLYQILRTGKSARQFRNYAIVVLSILVVLSVAIGEWQLLRRKRRKSKGAKK